MKVASLFKSATTILRLEILLMIWIQSSHHRDATCARWHIFYIFSASHLNKCLIITIVSLGEYSSLKSRRRFSMTRYRRAPPGLVTTRVYAIGARSLASVYIRRRQPYSHSAMPMLVRRRRGWDIDFASAADDISPTTSRTRRHWLFDIFALTFAAASLKSSRGASFHRKAVYLILPFRWRSAFSIYIAVSCTRPCQTPPPFRQPLTLLPTPRRTEFLLA